MATGLIGEVVAMAKRVDDQGRAFKKSQLQIQTAVKPALERKQFGIRRG